MQDDIIPRQSLASLTRLRNEIVETAWHSSFEREDWKGVVDPVTNMKHAVSSVQDLAQKLAEYAKFRGDENYSDVRMSVFLVTTSEDKLGTGSVHLNRYRV